MVAYRIFADLVVVVHAAYVAFVLFGLLVVLTGWWLGWGWVRNFWFRAAHLAAILIVCAEAVCRIECPLTTLERWLRRQSGAATYRGDFIGHWVHELIFFEAPGWVFTASYLAFGLLVVAAYVLVPPRRPGAGRAELPSRPAP